MVYKCKVVFGNNRLNITDMTEFKFNEGGIGYLKN